MTNLASNLLQENVTHPVVSIDALVHYWPGLHVCLSASRSPEPDKVDSMELTVDIFGVQNYVVIMVAPYEVDVIRAMGRGLCRVRILPGYDGKNFIIRSIKFDTDDIGWRQVYSPR